MLVKLSVLVENQELAINDIMCTIKLKNGNTFSSNALSARNLKFGFNSLNDNKTHTYKLFHHINDKFINHFTVIPKETAMSGYLIFCFDRCKDLSDLEATIFEFENFTNKKLILEIKESSLNSDKLLFDESIWDIQD